MGALLIAWILWSPVLPFGLHSPRGHLVVNTVDVCVALLAAYLAHGRFRRARRVSDLLLAQSLVTLALAGIVGQGLAGAPGTTEIWVSMALRVAASCLLLGAAVVGPGRTAHLGLTTWSVLGPVLALAVATWAVGPFLPDPLALAYQGDPVRPELLTSHPVLVGAHLLTAACLLLASHLFTVRALGTGDELLRWLGPACALGGFARISYALTPTLYTDWFYTGDLLRTGFYLLLLIGAAREVAQYWTSRTTQAVAQDRLRFARELHDGVVQELSYIRGEAHQIADPALRERILGASDRAVDESRAAISALTSPAEGSLTEMLRQAGRELARRHGVAIEVDGEHDVDVEPGQLHTLLRITREAVHNAARHGRAGRIRIDIGADERGRVIVVHDDGAGFDPAEAMRVRTGYGLVSMHERARSLPGTLEVDSEPGAGSEVRVRW